MIIKLSIVQSLCITLCIMLLSSSIIYYHLLSSIIIVYHLLFSITIYYNPLSSSISYLSCDYIILLSNLFIKCPLRYGYFQGLCPIEERERQLFSGQVRREFRKRHDLFLDYQYRYTGWWFGTFGLFFHILGTIIPTDFHIFQSGRYTTNQYIDGH